MEEHSITICNKRIYEFYKENPHLNIERMNLFFINVIEQITEKTNQTIDSSQIHLLSDKLKAFEEHLGLIKTNVNNIQYDVSSSFKDKLTEFKKEYLQDIQQFITIQSTETNEKMKNQNTDIIEHKMNQLLLQYHTLITSSEQRIDTKLYDVNNKLMEIKEINSTNQDSQLQLQNNLSNLLKKMENSNLKGKISENLLYNVLKSLYPYAQIDTVGGQKETGDFFLKRKNRPTILIENKNYNKNVLQDEVKKFIRDTEIQNVCGIFLSQTHSITNKENYEINFHNGNILVYVEEVNYDADKIKIAIDIIDQLKSKYDEMNANHNDESVLINDELLREINKEYQAFITQKILLTKTMKESFQKILKQHEESQFFNLDKFLASKYATSATVNLTCNYCDGYIAKNQSALSAHQRHCKLKMKQEEHVHVINQVVEKAEKIENTETKTKKNEKNKKESIETNEKDKKTTKEPPVEWNQNELNQLIELYNIKEMNILQISNIIITKSTGEIVSRLHKMKLIDKRTDARGYQEYKNSDEYKEKCSKGFGEKQIKNLDGFVVQNFKK